MWRYTQLQNSICQSIKYLIFAWLHKYSQKLFVKKAHKKWPMYLKQALRHLFFKQLAGPLVGNILMSTNSTIIELKWRQWEVFWTNIFLTSAAAIWICWTSRKHWYRRAVVLHQKFSGSIWSTIQSIKFMSIKYYMLKIIKITTLLEPDWYPASRHCYFESSWSRIIWWIPKRIWWNF